MAKEPVGFIGLGIMGAPMASHLLRGGHPLVVFNRTASKMDALVTQGAQAGRSARDVAARSDVVVSMVADSPDVEQVYLAADGVLAAARQGTLLIDMSTISPDVAVRVGRAAAQQGCPMLDAPVSGGDVGARNATLTIMVGGAPDTFERARPILELMGKPILCGPSGAGQKVKACNQTVTALHILAMAEALTLASKAGVDPATVLKVLGSGYAQSRILDLRGPRVLQGDFAPGFKARLHSKDLRIALETASAAGCHLPGASLVAELLSALVEKGGGELDHSALIQVIQSLSAGRPAASGGG
jgi:2-hydroxy-3-oxopropionate reductase